MDRIKIHIELESNHHGRDWLYYKDKELIPSVDSTYSDIVKFVSKAAKECIRHCLETREYNQEIEDGEDTTSSI